MISTECRGSLHGRRQRLEIQAPERIAPRLEALARALARSLGSSPTRGGWERWNQPPLRPALHPLTYGAFYARSEAGRVIHLYDIQHFVVSWAARLGSPVTRQPGLGWPGADIDATGTKRLYWQRHTLSKGKELEF
jgi:hypothetical protein